MLALNLPTSQMKKVLNKINCKIQSLNRLAGEKTARFCLPRIGSIPESQFSLIFPHSGSDKNVGNSSEVEALLCLALDAAEVAKNINLSDVSSRIRLGMRWPDIWPGEHYKLLAAIVANIKPEVVVEIGTFLGLSSLAMKKYMPEGGTLFTFDIFPWNTFNDTCFNQEDFVDGKLVQLLADLSQPEVFNLHLEILSKANIIFLDGPKNRSFEQAFLKQLFALNFSTPALLVIDDIRLWNMLDIWYEISMPKLDVTSLGHFSGTGFVMLSPK